MERALPPPRAQWANCGEEQVLRFAQVDKSFALPNLPRCHGKNGQRRDREHAANLAMCSILHRNSFSRSLLFGLGSSAIDPQLGEHKWIVPKPRNVRTRFVRARPRRANTAARRARLCKRRWTSLVPVNTADAKPTPTNHRLITGRSSVLNPSHLECIRGET